MNISSVIVYGREDCEQTAREIEALEGCEVHLQEQGVMIVSIEADGVEQEMELLERIKGLESVKEAHLHYSYSEEELERARDSLCGEVPSILDDECPLDEIRYSGSVYHQMRSKRS